MTTLNYRLLLAPFLLFAAATAAAQGNPQVINIALSRPGEPLVLDIGIMSARIEVIGEDRADAAFEISVQDSKRKIVTPSGTRSLNGGNFSYQIDEEDNEISVDTDWRAEKVFVTARIPQRADLFLSTTNDGEIIVNNITGNLELANVNGPVTATGIAGSVFAESVSDDIDISFRSIVADGAMSLTSVNGNLTLRLPSNAGAQLHLDSSQGEILSDFDVEVQPSKPTIERDDRQDGVSVRVENTIVALVNGGGPVIRLKTLNGDINIRQAAK